MSKRAWLLSLEAPGWLSARRPIPTIANSLMGPISDQYYGELYESEVRQIHVPRVDCLD